MSVKVNQPHAVEPPLVLEITNSLYRLKKVVRLESEQNTQIQSRTHKSNPLFLSLVKLTEQYTGVPVPPSDSSRLNIPTGYKYHKRKVIRERKKDTERKIYTGLCNEIQVACENVKRQDKLSLHASVHRMKSWMEEVAKLHGPNEVQGPK